MDLLRWPFIRASTQNHNSPISQVLSREIMQRQDKLHIHNVPFIIKNAVPLYRVQWALLSIISPKQKYHSLLRKIDTSRPISSNIHWLYLPPTVFRYWVSLTFAQVLLRIAPSKRVYWVIKLTKTRSKKGSFENQWRSFNEVVILMKVSHSFRIIVFKVRTTNNITTLI